MRVRIDYMATAGTREHRDVRTVVPEFELPKGWTLLDLKATLERREYRMVDVEAERAELEQRKRSQAAKAKAADKEAVKA